jgi:soluble lytic murein transglycosylase-like protein
MYKLYAHMKVLNDKQYRCLVILWRKESNWSPVAKSKSSTAYGIPQLLRLTETNPFKQIDAGIKYLDHRYDGDICKALLTHNLKGHY